MPPPTPPNKKIKNYIYRLKKIENKILDFVNDISYRHAKLQCKIIFIIGYTKTENLIRFGYLKV
jgi:hypothetical protein